MTRWLRNNYSKLDQYANSIDVVDKQMPQGVQTTTVLRVGNLVGDKWIRAKASVVLTNTSDKTYYISRVFTDCFLFDYAIYMENAIHHAYVNAYLKPGETMQIDFPGGGAKIVDDAGNDLSYKMREVVCEAAGKQLVTSCMNVTIENLLKSDIQLFWKEDPEADEQEGVAYGRTGVLIYKNESYYPK